MKALRPEAVRATYVFQALQRAGRALRGGTSDLYHLSHATTRIHAFWSHSWHGNKWMKVATLLFLSNSTPAALMGLAASVLTALAVQYNWIRSDSSVNYWCLPVGSAAYAMGMLFWRSRQLVFLDRICIHQCNLEKKVEGMFSLGAILKCADALLVLWDPSYGQRLWCLFELAGFLHCQPPTQKPRIVLRPSILGPVFFSATAGMMLMCGTQHLMHVNGFDSLLLAWLIILLSFAPMCFAAHIVRSYCRSVSRMRDEVAKVTLESAQCYCCSVQHRDPASGKDIEICDRRVLRRCVVEWFGSVEAFEHRVQHEVLEILTDQLSKNIFSYRRIAEASSVFMAFFLDTAGTSCRDGVLDECTERVLKGVAYWLAAVPSMTAVSYRVAWALQRQRIHRVLDMLVTLAVLLSMALTACSYVAFDMCLVWIIPDSAVLRVAIFVPISAASTAVVWRCLPVRVPAASVPSLSSTGPHAAEQHEGSPRARRIIPL
ncbi:Rai14 [Symbiodinium sp. CCMP2592]|nr:Rai14 [Symbiodinium sp. CCMP2592]